jgi:hypothetical protein
MPRGSMSSAKLRPTAVLNPNSGWVGLGWRIQGGGLALDEAQLGQVRGFVRRQLDQLALVECGAIGDHAPAT